MMEGQGRSLDGLGAGPGREGQGRGAGGLHLPTLPSSRCFQFLPWSIEIIPLPQLHGPQCHIAREGDAQE